MAYFNFSILFCMLLFAPSHSEATSPTNIFILASQSNMAGRGSVGADPKNQDQNVWDGYVPSESQANLSVLRLNPDHQWEEASEPLHRGIDLNKTVGIGSGMPFAHQFVASIGSKAGIIGLVPSARGGSVIKQWAKGQPFYNDLIARITVADKDGGTMRALFWLQGESDASDKVTALAYNDMLKTFFTDVRNDIKPRFLPIILVHLLPVKIASIDTYIKHENSDIGTLWAAEEAVHQELPDLQIIDAMEFVKADGIGLNKDHVHLSLTTQVLLGKRLADTYLSHYSKIL